MNELKAIQCINKRLAVIFEDNVNEFKRVMEESYAVISGSWIIQCMMDEFWQDSDIDIFVPGEIHRMILFFQSLNGTIIEEQNMVYKSILDNNHVKIKSIVTMFVCGHKIQLIQLDIEKEYQKLYHYLTSVFDFDIIKNMYYIDRQQEQLILCNINQIMTKSTVFQVGNSVMSSIKRYYRYNQRGIHIVNKMTLDDLTKNITNNKELNMIQSFYQQSTQNDNFILTNSSDDFCNVIFIKYSEVSDENDAIQRAKIAIDGLNTPETGTYYRSNHLERNHMVTFRFKKMIKVKKLH